MKGKIVSHNSLTVSWVYDRIPAAFKKELISSRKSSLNQLGNKVRLQCYLPLDVYTILSAFGGFANSESDFVTDLAIRWIHQQVKEQGLTGPLELSKSEVAAMNGGV